MLKVFQATSHKELQSKYNDWYVSQDSGLVIFNVEFIYRKTHVMPFLLLIFYGQVEKKFNLEEL